MQPATSRGQMSHASKKACKQESTPALKPRADATRSPKQEYQWPLKKTCISSIFFKSHNLQCTVTQCTDIVKETCRKTDN